MVDTATLDDLLNTGVRISAHEAVAIVQQLLTTRGEESAADEGRATTPDEVTLHADGTVTHSRVPSVEGAGRLLDAMLSCGHGVRVPGALRFTIARACQSVDAPVFESVAALSRALERFEGGPRQEIVRQLFVRAGLTSAPAVPTAEARTERRSAPHASALRRDLREADARVYELLQLTDSTPARELDPAAASPRRARWAAVAVAAVLGSFAAGYAVTELVSGTPVAAPTLDATSDTRPSPEQSTERRATTSVP